MKITCLTCLFFFSLFAGAQKHTVYFDFDIDEVNISSGQKLEDWIKANTKVQVYKIYGYTDKVGYSIYNVDLSQRRAAFVLEKLQQHNISISDSLEIKGFGEDFNRSSIDAQNRRVEIYYTPLPDVPEKAEKPLVKSDFTKKVEVSKVGDKLRLPNLYFYNYSNIVLPKSRPVLEELLKIMRENPKLRIDIQGHICCELVETGNISYLRAKAVYDYLVKNGIDKSRLSFKGLKNSQPVYPQPEKSDAERDANRRVEIEIIAN